MRGRDFVGQHVVAQRRSQTAPDPRHGAQGHQRTRATREREGGGREHGHGVPGRHCRTLARESLAESPTELRQAVHEVRETLDRSERGGA